MTTFTYDDLEKLDEAYLSEPDYSFDLIGAWLDPEGGIYLSTDSGCSCPTPWENHKQIEDFTGPLTVAQAIEEATSLWDGGLGEGYDPKGFKSFLDSLLSTERK